MTQSSDGFFSGGAKGITWPDEPPASVTGTIEAIFPKEEIMTIATPTTPSVPTGKFQKRIILQTDLRDRDIDDDDGRRTLYVKSWMRGAIAEALRKAGAKEPEIGAKLTVILDHTEPPSGPGLSKSKHFKAEYTSPASTFFSGDIPGTVGSAGTSNGEPQRPEAFDAATWATLPLETKKQIATTMSVLPGARPKDDEPPF